MKALATQRIAAHMINSVLQQYGMRQLAHKFVGDDDSHWIVVNEAEIRVVRDNNVVAHVYLQCKDGDDLPVAARVIVSDVYSVIRHEHVADFDPANYSIVILRGRDYKNDKRPDIDVTIQAQDLESVMHGIHGARRKIPTSTLTHKPKMIGGLAHARRQRANSRF